MYSEHEADAVADKVQALLQEHAGSIGPQRCDDAECDECSHIAPGEITRPMLSEFIVVMQWTDMETGEAYSTSLAPSAMLRTHRRGLLLDWVDTLAP